MNAVEEIEADYAIVGTGAGGATAARVLSEAGRSLVLLEEGPQLGPKDRPRDALSAMRLSFRDMGTMATKSRTPFPVLQGRLVGGSTAINSGIIWRLPDDVRAVWREQYGLAGLIEDRDLDRVFAQIETELAIGETPPDVRGKNAELMELACEALGLPGKAISRNVRGCVGSARCLQGCPGTARQSMDVSYIPFAVARGATLWPLSRVDRITIESGRAVGVEGSRLDPESRRPIAKFKVRARRGVIVSAGVVHTPLLLWKAGLRGLVGQRFQAHPGIAVVGRFNEEVAQGFGATQAYEVPMRDRGYKIETLSMLPEMLATRMPGVGPEWQARLAELGHYAHWVAQVRMQALGRIKPGMFGGPVLTYEPLPEDLARVREATALLVRMFFAAGATEVSHGIAGLEPYFTRPEQAELIERGEFKQGQFHLLASHLFGTACAGSDPSRSVVAPNLEAHAVRGLYVMDGSVFPTNLGVNPQHSIMALAFRAAEQLT